MSELREENLILHKVVHEAAHNQITLQNQVENLNNSVGKPASQSLVNLPTPLNALNLSRREVSIQKNTGFQGD